MERVGYSDHLIGGHISYREHNDCAVMTWATCFDCSYEKAHAWLKKHGRKDRRGMYVKDLKQALLNCKKVKVKFGPYESGNGITLSQFVKKHPVGRYYIFVRGHFLCVKDGIVYDHSDKPRRIVRFAARIYLEGEL